MATQADFGVKTSYEDGLKPLLAQLAKIPEHAKAIEAAMKAAFDNVDKASKKIVDSFVDGQAKTESVSRSTTAKLKEIATERVKNEEDSQAKITAAADRARQKEESAKQAAAEKDKQRSEALRRGQEALEQQSAETVKRYAALKEEYEKKSVDDVRAKIHEFEQDVRVQRKQTADAVQKLTEQGDKEAAQAIKQKAQLQINASEKELQLYRSLEKEKIGRTFSEQMERIKLEEKSDKEIAALLHKQAEEFKELQVKMTVTQDAEEKKRLKMAVDELKAENAAVKKEAEERHIQAPKEEKHGGGHGNELLEAGAVLEGLNLIREKSEEAAAAEKQLSAGTGQTGEALEKTGEMAEEVGKKFALSGEASKNAMGKVAATTHATGEELKKQTEAVEAYAIVHGKNAEMVAKQFATEKGRAKIMAEAELNVAKAAQAAATPAANLQRIQNELTETIGKLALTVLNALGPAIQAVVPVVEIAGKLLGDTLKPILEQLSPVITLIANGFKNLAPVVVDLIQGALSLIQPILEPILNVLKFLIPVIVDVATQLGTALKPVFAALAPIIQELTEVFSSGLIDVLKVALIPVLQILLPILTQLLVPVLLALMPILKSVADILNKVLTPTFKALSGAINYVVSGALKPLVGFITGVATGALQGIIGTISKVTSAISSVVSSVTSVLGLSGDKAKDAAKKTGEAVNAQEKENAQASLTEKMQADERQKAEHTKHLMDMLKIGKLSADEEQELREHAAEESNDILTAKLDAYDKKKQSQAEAASKKAQSAAKKDAKSKLQIQQDAAKDWLNQQKADLDAEELTEREKKTKELALETEFAQKVLDIKGQSQKQLNAATAALHKAQMAERKNDLNNELSDISEATERQIAEVELRGLKENKSEREINAEKFRIEDESLKKQIEAKKKFNEDSSRLEMERATLELKHAGDVKKAAEDLQKEADAAAISNEKDKLERLKAGMSTEADLAKQEAELAIKEENARWDEEQIKRRDDMAQNNALKEALETNHQNKLIAIQRDAQEKSKAEAGAFLQSGLEMATGTWKERGDKLKAYLLQELKQLAITEAAKALTTQLGQAKQTALVVAGFVARQATYVAEGIASAASAAGTWIATAAKAVFNAFESMPFPLDIVAAATSLAGVVALATQVPKMFPGHKDGTAHSPGGWHWVGEDGPELMKVPRGAQVMPNHRVSSVAGSVDLSPLLHHLDSINRGIQHGNVLAARTNFVMPINGQFENARNNFLKSEDRRSA